MRDLKGVDSRDLLDLKTNEDVRISPDGGSVLWVETRMDKENNCYRSRIMRGFLEEGTVQILTSGTHRDTHPRWSPQGDMVAFLSDRPAGKNRDSSARQIWLISSTGGEARRLTDLRHGVKEFSWSPEGNRLAVVAPLPPEGIEREDDPDPYEDDLYRKHNRETRVITRIRFRWDGTGYFDDNRLHLGVMKVDPTEEGPSAPEFITQGAYDVTSPAWSPCGEYIAFVSNLDPENDYQRHLDLYRIKADGGEPEKLTRSLGPVASPVFSPDGRRIAFFGHSQPEGHYSNDRLWLLDLDQEDLICLTRDWDYSVGDRSLSDVRSGGPVEPIWSSRGDEILFAGSVRGRVQLFRSSLVPGEPQPLSSGDHVISGISADSSCTRVALILLDPLSPGRIHVGRVDSGALEHQEFHDPNSQVLAKLDLSRPERFSFESDDLSLDGWILKPPGFDPGQSYPAVLQIHGGPMAMYGDCFFHEFQFLASQGLVVVYSNPRGSQGYGEDFCGCIRGEWGDLDYKDVMACMDAALERFPFIDKERLGVTGGSYGGFMTNWIITHTDRFQAAVTQRSVVNRYSGYGTSDIGFFLEGDLGGPPWEVPMKYLEISPIFHIANCQTPTMIIHSDMDLRCPIEGAEQLYVSLKKLGVETEFVRFSGESHGLSRGGRPWRRVFRLDKIAQWMTRYLVKE